ncbi:MAG: ATP-binding protein [Cyanobacteria bacterium J06623_7]
MNHDPGLDPAHVPPHTPPESSLEDLASTMVHDLQAPLRSLTMFTELLAREYQDNLDDKGKLYLNRISHSGLRMQTLIEDLLAYSRAGTGDQTWMTVDLNQTLERVQSDLQSEIAESKAQIAIEELPQVFLNPREIHQVFQNLIENALKFSGDQPQIAISVTSHAREWLFAVQDNGIGIESEFQTQIFEVFQRLHSAEDYPGSGMGLAICQKIIERYQGTIWVESEPNQGSTFYFTLPMNTSPQSATAKAM